MELSNSRLYRSSTLQANLLYRYLLEDLPCDLSENFQSQWTETNQNPLYLYPQILLEVLVLPMSGYLETVSNPHFLQGKDTIYWDKIQLKEMVNLSAFTRDTEQKQNKCIDIMLSELLFGLSKNIVKKAKQFKTGRKFVKILFPVEGMFDIRIEERKICFSYEVRHLITSEYQNLSDLTN